MHYEREANENGGENNVLDTPADVPNEEAQALNPQGQQQQPIFLSGNPADIEQENEINGENRLNNTWADEQTQETNDDSSMADRRVGPEIEVPPRNNGSEL